jgi:hypothetical protein
MAHENGRLNYLPRLVVCFSHNEGTLRPNPSCRPRNRQRRVVGRTPTGAQIADATPRNTLAACTNLYVVHAPDFPRHRFLAAMLRKLGGVLRGPA